MKDLSKEVQEVFDSIETARPVYKLSVRSGWRGDEIRLERVSKHSVKSESFLSDTVMQNTEFAVDFENGVIGKELDKNVYTKIKNEMLSSIVSFVHGHYPSKNPKLTVFYKWFKNLSDRYNSTTSSLDHDEKNRLEDLLFNVYKYIKTSCDTREHRQNCIKILEFIKNKYDNQVEIR